MFDGPTTTPRSIEISEISKISIDAISSPIETAGFADSNEAYQRLKQQAMDKILKAAPKHMRALIESGGW